ncbi:hypothetical protein PCL_05322 [Purpureocillium lilacinum]|uniref:Uncharacterized protein n=1 Tax=Purpureocillium lilacinum TaxID=33203 RepID=A0A2U3DV52_PURLI|nr:hypothetical protein PCL_05322 [Purpureocillium lilacinum]
MHCLTSRPGRNIPFNRTHGFANGPVKAVADARVEEPDGAAIAAQDTPTRAYHAGQAPLGSTIGFNIGKWWRTVADAPRIWNGRLRNRQFGAAIKGNEDTDGWEASLDKKTASLADLDGSLAMFIWKMLPDGLD